jgi:hypothetical protein
MESNSGLEKVVSMSFQSLEENDANFGKRVERDSTTVWVDCSGISNKVPTTLDSQNDNDYEQPSTKENNLENDADEQRRVVSSRDVPGREESDEEALTPMLARIKQQ